LRQCATPFHKQETQLSLTNRATHCAICSGVADLLKHALPHVIPRQIFIVKFRRKPLGTGRAPKIWGPWGPAPWDGGVAGARSLGMGVAGAPPLRTEAWLGPPLGTGAWIGPRPMGRGRGWGPAP